jgi:hypothetical protein
VSHSKGAVQHCNYELRLTDDTANPSFELLLVSGDRLLERAKPVASFSRINVYQQLHELFFCVRYTFGVYRKAEKIGALDTKSTKLQVF